MRDLSRLLREVADLYSQLQDALVPGGNRAPGDPGGSPDPVASPAPARLDVIEQRHLLLRGLRWWCDAVDPDLERTYVIGNDVARMCDYLIRWAHVMAPEDVETLAGNLQDWINGALPLVGSPSERRVSLPPGAEAQVVPVHEAAKLLGVTVRTIRRRTPDRADGMVKLGDALSESDLCVHALWARTCALCGA